MGPRPLGPVRVRRDAGQAPSTPSRCDVADWEAVARATKLVASEWNHRRRPRVLRRAPRERSGPAVAANPARWSATVRANLDGTFNAIRSFHALLTRAPRRAKVVCFSGGGATKPRPNFSAYGVAKTGIVRLVETIAEEESQAPLDINAVAPGAIATRLTDEVIALGPDIAGQAEYDSALKQIAGGGASLERALDLVEWLLSAKSDGISGQAPERPVGPVAGPRPSTSPRSRGATCTRCGGSRPRTAG